MARRFNPRLRWGTALALGLILPYLFWPRHASLRDYNPQAVGALETEMWRSYYEHRSGPLALALYRLHRSEYGFSPWDSALIAYSTAQAAMAFQPSRSRQEAASALPYLERYFAVLQRHGGESFDVPRAARLELEWWQLRREQVGPDIYGEAVARVGAELFGTSADTLRPSAIRRAQMMQYRDERADGRMTPDDWTQIEAGLVESYTLLAKALRPNSPTSHRSTGEHDQAAKHTSF